MTTNLFKQIQFFFLGTLLLSSCSSDFENSISNPVTTKAIFSKEWGEKMILGAHKCNEIEKLQYKKSENSRYWEIIEETQTYFDSGCLYEGHLCYNNRNYFLMENGLKTKRLKGVNAMLVSMDDAKFQSIFRKWKFPRKEDEISFSRNVEMQNKHISSVQIIYDKDNELYSDISDLFLRNFWIDVYDS